MTTGGQLTLCRLQTDNFTYASEIEKDVQYSKAFIWRIMGSLIIMSALACKKKDKDDPSSDQNPGGSGGSGNTSIGVIEFRVRGELLRFSVREAYYMYGRAQAFSHKLNRPSDTLGCTISFAYPTSRSDTSYSANITARSEIFVFIYTLYRSQGDSTYSSQTVFKSPRFSMNVSVSNNQAQGTFSGWVYDSVDPNDSLQITDGQFQIQF